MPPQHPVPVVVVVGMTAPDAAGAGLTLQCDLPGSVVVRHEFAGDRLLRVVSDAGGVVEQEAVDLEHACLSCALREDVVPTLIRLAETARWSELVAVLPPTTDPLPVCRMVAHGVHQGRAVGAWLDLRAVVATVDGPGLTGDVLGDDLLAERGWALGPDDLRAVGQAVTAQVEFADHLVLVGEPDQAGRGLLRQLARAGVPVVADTTELEVAAVLLGRDDAAAHRAVDPRSRCRAPVPDDEHVASVVMTSWKPFHPARLRALLEDLAPGGARTRGCFWLPTRPHDVLAWEHSGGQLSIGDVGPWVDAERGARLVSTGRPEVVRGLPEVFGRALMTDAEMTGAALEWSGRPDGFEPWLGGGWSAAS